MTLKFASKGVEWVGTEVSWRSIGLHRSLGAAWEGGAQLAQPLQLPEHLGRAGTPLQAWKALPYFFCWVDCSSFKTQLGHQLAWAFSKPAGWVASPPPVHSEHPGLLVSLHFFLACHITDCFQAISMVGADAAASPALHSYTGHKAWGRVSTQQMIVK